MLTIESTYEILDAAPMADDTPLLPETVSILDLIDSHKANGHEGVENQLESLCHAIDGVLWAYGHNGRVIGGYTSEGGTLFSIDNPTMPSPATAAAIRRRLDARRVVCCPGAVMVQW